LAIESRRTKKRQAGRDYQIVLILDNRKLILNFIGYFSDERRHRFGFDIPAHGRGASNEGKNEVADQGYYLNPHLKRV
jgi:hypothetical protein